VDQIVNEKISKKNENKSSKNIIKTYNYFEKGTSAQIGELDYQLTL
jgi:hypothetical protein